MARILIYYDDIDDVAELFDDEGIDYELDSGNRFMVEEDVLDEAINTLESNDFEYELI